MATKLPRIDQRGGAITTESTKNFEQRTINESTEKPDYVSPFRLPSDDEVFVYREVERKKREELKQVSQDLKIWDKKTGTSRKPLRLFKNTEVSQKENIKTSGRAGYNPKDKAMIVEAQQIINERRKTRDTNGKDQNEGIVELLEQKKEMFLVERTVGIIEQERETLIQKATEKEDALKKSEEMLNKDMKEFDSYKQNNKQETDQAIQRYNQEVELRKRTEMEFKIKNNELTSLKAENSKNDELIEKYLAARNFLLKLTPKEIIEQQEREVNEKIEELKAQLQRNSRDESHSVLSDSHGKGFNRDKKGVAKKPASSEQEKALVEMIEESKLSQDMYFDDPEQLIEIYTRLEEGNLSLIQMMQDTEQNLENLKNSLKQKKVEFDKKISGLRDNKMQLEKSKHEKENKIKTLDIRAKEPQLSKKYDGLVPLRKKILEVANMFKEDTKGNLDIESLPNLELLAMIELNLEKQLERINEYRPARVLELKRLCEDTRKAENRKHQLERENEIAEEKRAKANERAKEKPKKRTGRLDMMKSTPLEKKEVVTQVAQTNEEEEDMKYYKPYMTKF